MEKKLYKNNLEVYNSIYDDYFIKEFFNKKLFLENFPLKESEFRNYLKSRGLIQSHEVSVVKQVEDSFFPLFIYTPPLIKDTFIKFYDKEKQDYFQVRENKYNSDIHGPKKGKKTESYYSPRLRFSRDMKWQSVSKHITTTKKTPIRNQEPRLREDREAIYYYMNYDVILFDLIQNKKYIPITQYYEIRKVLIKIQKFFYPVSQSNGRTVVTTSDYNENVKLLNNSKPEDIDVEDIELARTYKLLANRAEELMGNTLQLWKNIAVLQRRELTGITRLGIDYLEWSLMLKKCLEFKTGHEILDIDEINSLSESFIVKTDPTKMEGYFVSRRNFRNRMLGDDYHSIYSRRLYYMSNELDINFLPNLKVYTEGETEIFLLEVVLNLLYGYTKDRNLGIVFENVQGSYKYLSIEKHLSEIREILKNISSSEKIDLISKNSRTKLNKKINSFNKKYKDFTYAQLQNKINSEINDWQIIPYFFFDKEGTIGDFLTLSKISIQKKDYHIPSFLKSISFKQRGNYKGNSIELTNFTNEEIVLAIKKTLSVEITESEIQNLRENEKSLSSLKRYGGKLKEPTILSLFCKELSLILQHKTDTELQKLPLAQIADSIVLLSSRNFRPTNKVSLEKNFQIIQEAFEKDTS